MKLMHKFFAGGVAVWLSCFCISISAQEQKAAPSEATLNLIKDAQNVARSNDPEKTVEAYAKVFKTTDATPVQLMNAYMDIARVYTLKEKYAEAVAEFDKAFALEGLESKDKINVLNRKAEMYFNSNFRGAFASYYTDGVRTAAKIYEQIIALPYATNMDKINAYKNLANCYFEQMDVETATATLDKAVKLPNLEPKELLDAKINYAIGIQRQLRYAEAIALFDEILKFEGLHVNTKNDIRKRILACMSSLKKSTDEIQKKMTELETPKQEIAAFCASVGENDKARKLFEEILNDPASSVDARAAAASGLCETYSGEPTKIIEIATKYLAPAVAEKESLSHYYGRLLGWATNDPEYVRWVTAKILENPKIHVNDKIKNLQRLCDLEMRLGNLDSAKKNIALLLEIPELQADARLRLEIISALIDSKGKTDGILKKLNDILAKSSDKEITKQERADFLMNAIRIAMGMKYSEIAKYLVGERDKMSVKVEIPSINCTFIKNGPKDITGFLNSDYFKNEKNQGVLNRKYGTNLQFLLETDAAMTGRVITGSDGKEFVPTVFVTTCDENGINFFFYTKTDKAKDIADRLAGFGGYEIYFAAGPEAPYLCYLVDPPYGNIGSFTTQYDNANFRRSDTKFGTLDYSSEVLGDAVVMLVKIPWTLFFNQLPGNGDKWQFEPIHWERGGYSWGGSESVHHRSSFGNIVFTNLTKENLNAIKRRLVVPAASAYRRSLSANNGFLERWKDPELGDQEFYYAKVKPLEDKLSGYLQYVKAGMTDEEVEMLYSNAVPEWMNIDYILAQMRRDYLDEKRVSGK